LIASLSIIFVSTALFLYWFRYTCLLIIDAKGSVEAGAQNYALKVTDTIRLSYPHLERELVAGSQTFVLDTLHEGLANDYRILTDLLQQFTEGESIEHRILLIDYKLMQSWYAFTRHCDNLTGSRKALREMSLILNCFAAEIGESAAL